MDATLDPLPPHSTRASENPARPLFKALPGLVSQASIEWINDNVPRLGASVAFYAVLSMAPIIIILVAIAAIVYGPEAAQGRLAMELEGIAGHQVARTIQEFIKGAYEPRTGIIATSLGLATLLLGASSMFVELRDSMNTIWGVPIPVDRSHVATLIRLVRERFYSFVTVTSIGFLLLLTLILNAWFSAMQATAGRVAGSLCLYLVVVILFAALYKIIPDVSLEWSDVILGAILTSVLFMLGKYVMGLYFAHANFGSSYGAAGSPIVILLWVYYSAQLFFWGAEFSKIYAKTLGSHSARQI